MGWFIKSKEEQDKERLDHYRKNPMEIHTSRETQEDFSGLWNKYSKPEKTNKENNEEGILHGIRQDIGEAIDLKKHIKHRLEVNRIKRHSRWDAELELAKDAGKQEAKQKFVKERRQEGKASGYMRETGMRALNIFGGGGGSDNYNKRAMGAIGYGDSNTLGSGMDRLDSFSKGIGGGDRLADFERRAQAALEGKVYKPRHNDDNRNRSRGGSKSIHIHVD